jgi:hypothetical protein
VNAPAGYSILDYRGKRSKDNISPLNKKRHNSSEDSSIASAMNLSGSVPFNLPGAVDASERSEGDRPGSALTLEDVSISMSQPDTMDVAIQCSPSGSSVTRYRAPDSPQMSWSTGTKGEHSKRLHSVNTLVVHDSLQQTQSLPGTPLKQRRSPEGGYFEDPPRSPPVPFTVGRRPHTAGGSRGKEGRELRNRLSDGRHSADQVLAERQVSDF